MEIEHPNILILIFAFIAASGATYGVGGVLVDAVIRWRNRVLTETEMEMEEVLVRMPAEAVMNISMGIGAVAAVVAFILVLVASASWNWQVGLMAGAIIFVLTISLPRYILKILKTRWRTKFHDQLEEALMSMSNALKAGFSIRQAIEMVIRQDRQPISIEFKLLIQQTDLGMALEDALFAMARRIESDDFHLVAGAISTARITGGDLTGVFDNLAFMIRERIRIQRRVEALTAMGRMQGNMLAAIPVLFMIAMFFIKPDMIFSFFSTAIGVILLVVVVLLVVCGFLAIRKIVNIEV